MTADRLDGAFVLEHYHSYTCGTVRAVLEIVQVGSRLGGAYRFSRHDNGEVPWTTFPEHDGDVLGEEPAVAPPGPDGKPLRWRLSIAGVECFARFVDDGRVGLVRPGLPFFTDHLEPIQVAPAGEPYRDIARHLQSLIDLESSTHPRAGESRTLYVSTIARALDEHPRVRAALPDADRLVRREPVDLRALLDATRREATRDEHAYFDAMRAHWAPRLA